MGQAKRIFFSVPLPAGIGTLQWRRGRLLDVVYSSLHICRSFQAWPGGDEGNKGAVDGQRCMRVFVCRRQSGLAHTASECYACLYCPDASCVCVTYDDSVNCTIHMPVLPRLPLYLRPLLCATKADAADLAAVVVSHRRVSHQF